MHGSGDVKYHLGTEGTFTALDGEQIKVSLAANPSHLEAVDPVLEGIVRAKQDLINKAGDGFTVLPILMHGDAAFAGQGVVAETLNLSQLRGYRTGGTIHVVVNNQVGFTTSPVFSRSSVYCDRRRPDGPGADLPRERRRPRGRASGSPQLAFEFRQAFNKDVVIDLVCYRRRGHNEGDDPSMTQPLMYHLIEAKRSVRKLYTEALIGRGDITLEEAEAALKDYQAPAGAGLRRDPATAARRRPATDAATGTASVDDACPPAAGARPRSPIEVVKRIADAHVNLPEGFTVHPRLMPQLRAPRGDGQRRRRSTGRMGETAGLRLAADGGRAGPAGRPGHPARHLRPAARRPHRPGAPARSTRRCSYLSDDQAPVLGLRLAALASTPRWASSTATRWPGPTRWCCGRRSSATSSTAPRRSSTSSSRSGEQKWGQRSGVVLLLPHGYEGQGPDHSSARIERFLQLCAENNMTVAMPSTPASATSTCCAGRRIARTHRPLVVFTPKSMLRLKAAAARSRTSPAATFQPVHRRPDVADAGAGAPGPAVQRQGLLRPGRAARDKQRRHRHARSSGVEQLYPLPAAELGASSAQLPETPSCVWVQEEPANQGAVAVHRAEPARLPRRPVPRCAGVVLAAAARRRTPRAARLVEDARRWSSRRWSTERCRPLRTGPARAGWPAMYFTDRGIEELAARRGEEQVSLDWLADQLRDLRRPAPRVRGARRAAGHLAGPPRRDDE